jgi:FKBP-type peptidyl-prolyl cis-trans isomerase SlyD
MPPTTIQDGVVVSLAYTLTVDGEVLDQSSADDPLLYLHGADNIIPGLEKALYGLAVGDSKQVVVEPEEGYGDYDPDDVEEVGRDLFPEDLELIEGMLLAMRDETGGRFEATVVEIGDDYVVLDFNHPLAGETLHFDVRVLELRDPTPEEIAHGHPHVPGMNPH